ncbi:MAG TPA: fumarate hydratase [Acidobacteriota bacterium]|nr:fumarate hydratase [Acidobacteriota bacterium]
MRTIQASTIVEKVAELCMEASFELGDDVRGKFTEYKAKEESPTAKAILEQLETNANIARDERVPMCQDTGFAVFFVELGSDLHVEGMTLTEAINEGVRKGYKEGYLRKSVLKDALRRENTGDNTPAIVHISIVPGDKLKITHMQKGGGSENMSRVKLLKPADGVEGVKQFVLEAVSEAGPNPCPPIVVGVGIGGTFEVAAYHAKKSLLRPLGSPNPDPYLDEVEKELLEKINKMGIGPQGMGGRTTALAVHVISWACHIASLPAAVNIECHAHRHKTAVL